MRPGEPAPDPEAVSQPDLAEWEEERTALEAIYDQEITFHSPSWTTLRLAVPGCQGLEGQQGSGFGSGAGAGAAQHGEATLHLECWAPEAGAYPQQLPTLAAR